MQSDVDEEALAAQSIVPAKVGYCNPPVHTRFKPGQSGNPSGRSKGSQNLKTIFNKVLDEEISLREGSEVTKVSKAEALVRGMVVGALKGDQRNLLMLFRVAEQTGQFEDKGADITEIRRVVVRWKGDDDETETEY
jgi:hypothetical protein